MINPGELLALVAMWCEQSHVNLADLHQCRTEILVCVSTHKKTDKALLECFENSLEPEAEAT